MRRVSSAARELASEQVANFSRPAAKDGDSSVELVVAPQPGKWLPVVRAVMGRLQRLWTAKPTANLHFLTGVPDRTIRHWFNKNVDIPASALIAVLHTDDGDKILDEAMRGSKCKWYAQIDEWRRKAAILDQTVAAAQHEFPFDVRAS